MMAAVVAPVTPAILLGSLRKIEARGALEVALRERQWTSALFRYGIATGRARDDPASVLRGALRTVPVDLESESPVVVRFPFHVF
jgi:hypothetical protein